MKEDKYERWITYYRCSGRPVAGHCFQVCQLMRATFPELILHGGYVHTRLGQDLHYWLTTPEGKVVDPTASQFIDLHPDDYEDAGTTDQLQLLERFFLRERLYEIGGD